MADPRPLTKDGKLKMDPVFIKGGEELVYTVQESPTQLSLMVLKMADGTIERYNAQATTSEFEPAFTADGKWMAFIQNRGNLNLKLVIRDIKQAKDAVFDPGGGFASIRRPTIAPDGSRVAYALPDATGQHIVYCDNQGQNVKHLTQKGINNWPAFSPDGKRIAFGSSRDGDFEIYTMTADGDDVRRLTNSVGLDARPAWSPDGKRIAFTSNRDGRYQIYVMQADGTNQRRVRLGEERDDYAAWHPDGKRLAIVSEKPAGFDLYLVDAPE